MKQSESNKFENDPTWAFENFNFKSIHASLKFVDGENVASKFIFTFFGDEAGWAIELGDFNADAEWSEPILMNEYDPVTGLRTYQNPELSCYDDIIAKALKAA